MADVSVRPAGPSDAAEIGRIQVLTWRIAYATVLPTPVLDALSDESVAETWWEAITNPPSRRHHVLVATEGPTTVGFTAVGPSGDASSTEGEPDGEIAILLVEPRWGRRGHGSRLLAAGTDFLRDDAITHAVIWLPEADSVSTKFFDSTGWAPDGYARTLDTGAGSLREIRLHASLEAEPQ
jgi:GNAT superfamily N-acetyltransferase